MSGILAIILLLIAIGLVGLALLLRKGDSDD